MNQSLTNPVWAALTTHHRVHASGTPRALRYPRDIAPFGAVRDADGESLRDLSTLLADDEEIWVVGPRLSETTTLRVAGQVDCLQLVMPPHVVAPSMAAVDSQRHAVHKVVELSATDSEDMVKLTTVAFPGFFRARTSLLGYYCGIRDNTGELIAMAGERFSSGSCREISAVCTHPSSRGQGLAPAVMWRVIERHRAEGLVSWLHVATTNTTAIRVYRSMGFVEHAVIRATQISRA